jgi:hypothetical protein
MMPQVRMPKRDCGKLKLTSRCRASLPLAMFSASVECRAVCTCWIYTKRPIASS